MADDRRIPDRVLRLLSSSIDSVERLDILLYLRLADGKPFPARTVASACRIPITTAEHELAVLCGRGFLTVTVGSDLLYAYAPMSPTIALVFDEIVELNGDRRPELLAKLSESPRRDPVRAFANAFV